MPCNNVNSNNNNNSNNICNYNSDNNYNNNDKYKLNKKMNFRQLSLHYHYPTTLKPGRNAASLKH